MEARFGNEAARRLERCRRPSETSDSMAYIRCFGLFNLPMSSSDHLSPF